MSDKEYTSEDIQALCNACSRLVKATQDQSKRIDELIKKPPLKRLYVTKGEAAELSGISTRKLEGMIAAGALPTVKHSRSVMIRLKDLENLPTLKNRGGIPQEALPLLEKNEAPHA